jgi:hypothetical protein
MAAFVYLTASKDILPVADQIEAKDYEKERPPSARQQLAP